MAAYAFLLAIVAFLACLAAVFDEHGLTAGIFPVFRTRDGFTPVGLMTLLVAVPLCVICIWVGFVLIKRGNDPAH
jgi:hypothetical protein